MLVTLFALIVGATPSLYQTASTSDAAATASPARPSLTGRDSTRVLRVAQKAQADFETMRRRLLPYEPLGGGDCSAVVGTYCYRQQIAAPPREASAIVDARARLLTTLDSVNAMLPGDRWVLGQRVRYFIEAGRPNSADSMAVVCAGRNDAAETRSWCLALVGYTAQQYGNFLRADAAFSMALERMPEPERCKWQDPSQLLGWSARSYRRFDCDARDSVAAGFWRLVQPLYLNEVNDLRTEFLARITRTYIEQDTRTPMSDWLRPDDRATLLRYGVPLWYARGDIPRGESRPQIAGFRREPSFNFFPGGRAFSSPNELTVEDWEFYNVVNRPTYAPLWAIQFQPITDHQVALFRRGDSAMIVAAFDANDYAPLNERRRVGTFAAVVDRGGVLTPIGTTIEQMGIGVVSTLVAPWRDLVVSLETLHPASGSASRARFAPKLPITSGRLSLSDLLFYTPRDSAPKSLLAAVPRALHAARAPSNRQIGVFWEAYGARSEGENFAYALLVTPIDRNILHRALVSLHVVDPDRTLSVQWREAPATANGIASRGLTVDLSRLRPGRYSVRLMLTSGADLPIVAERSIDIF